MSARKERERGWAGVCNLIWSPPQPPHPTPPPLSFFLSFFIPSVVFSIQSDFCPLGWGGGTGGGGRGGGPAQQSRAEDSGVLWLIPASGFSLPVELI